MTLRSSKLRNLPIYTIGTLLFIVILNSSLGLFRYPFFNLSPFEAIPTNTAFIFQAGEDIESFSEVIESAGLKDLPLVQKLETERKLIQPFLQDSILETRDLKTLVTVQNVGAAKVDFLYVFDLRDTKLDRALFKDKLSRFRTRKFTYQGYEYQSIKINSETSFTFFNYRNLLLVSKYPVLIEDGIRQLKSFQDNLTAEKDFKTLAKNRKETSSLYINFKKLPEFFDSYLNDDSQLLLKALPNLANWLVIDLDTNASNVLSGNYTDPKTYSLDKEREDLKASTLLELVPDNTGFLFMQQTLSVNEAKDSIFQGFIQPWFSKEWALSIVNPRTSADRLLFLKTDKLEYAKHYLERYGRLNGELKTITYQTFPIVQLMEHDLLNPFLNHLKLDLQNPYYTIINDYIIFSKSRQGLEMLIDKSIVGQSILKNEDFLKYLNTVSDKSDALVYFDGASVLKMVERLLIKNIVLKDENKIVKQLESLSGGLEYLNGKKYGSLEVHFSTKDVDEQRTNIVWKTALPAKIKGTPKPIWNKETKEYEIVVQDELHNLYLLNDSGEILWKKALKDTLLSEIYEIDYHEDGQLKLFFNTASNVYLLDRNGKNIGNFPLHLQSPATNGMCVVDFRKNRKYQFFLSCQNGHAYGFTKEGNPLFGWNPKRNVGSVSLPFQDFQSQGKDHIVVLNDEGRLTSFNSEGRRNISSINLGKTYQSNPEILNIGKRKVIALANERGQIKIINNKGRMSNLSVKEDWDHSVKLAFANITSASEKDFLILNKNKVACYIPEKKQLQQHFEIALNDEQDEVFGIKATHLPYSCFGTLSTTRKQINLFNAQNALHPDFPLAGTTPFSIVDLYNTDREILIVGYDNSIYAYHIGRPAIQ